MRFIAAHLDALIAYVLIVAVLITGFVASFFGDAEWQRRRRLRTAMRTSRLSLGTAALPNRRRNSTNNSPETSACPTGAP